MSNFTSKLRPILMGIALLIALSYTFGYDYIYRAIAKTYFRGETTPDIGDAAEFPSHIVAHGNPVIWPKSEFYNKTKLPVSLTTNLRKTNTTAFLVIKNGKILHEEYWDGTTAATASNSFGMTNGIMALLLGEAISDKKIRSENQPYSDFYPSYSKVEFGNKLTLKHLANMEAGLNWEENYTNPFTPYAKAYYGKSLAEASFRINFKENPGINSKFQSGASQLLGFAIRKAVNMPLAAYLSSKIWEPLGMEQNANWSVDDNGMEKTFCCLHSNARDYAKLGQLLLDNGKAKGSQIVDSVWLNKMRTPTNLSKGAYGLGLWINNDNPVKHYFFSGLYGQYIVIIPEKNTIIVRLGDDRSTKLDSKNRPEQVDFLVNETSKVFK